MADPNTPIDPDQTKVIEEQTNAFNIFNEVAGRAADVIHGFDTKLKETGIDIQRTTALTQEQITKFGLLSTAALGTRQIFKSYGSMEGLNPLQAQLKDVAGYLKENGTAAGVFGNALRSLGQKVTGNETVDQLQAMLENLAISADNGERLQHVYLQLGAKTGDLGKIYSAAGDNLSKMNYLLATQEKMISSAAKATGLSRDEVEKYYTELGTIPGALSSIIDVEGKGNEKTSMLTASIKLATGANRSHADVVKDLREAYRDYNLQGNEALKFVARMSEIANKHNLEIDDVRASLTSTSETFKMFGNNAEGAAKMMSMYVDSLKATGISGPVAIDIVGNMTRSISGLSLAQKSFLSAQTGGAGGLMGGFQIEKMLKEGKIDEVFAKVRQQMKKQFGEIVTLEEGSTSPQKAAQLAKQMTILKQGPLGQFARTDQEAFRILDAFKKTEKGEKPKLSETIVSDTISKGNDIQRMSYTELSHIRQLIEEMRGKANIANKETKEAMFSAGQGSEVATDEIAKNKMRANMALGEKQSFRAAAQHQEEMRSGKPTRSLGGDMSETSKELINTPSDTAASLKSGFEFLKQTFKVDSKKSERDQEKQIYAEIQKAKKKANGEEYQQLQRQEQDLMKFAKYFNPEMSLTEKEDKSKTAGAKVGEAIPRKTKDERQEQKEGDRADTQHKHQQGGRQDIYVHVKGYCLKCKHEIDNISDHAAPAARGGG